LADIAVEGIQAMAQQNVQEAIGEQEGSQANLGSWRIAGLAWWMSASWLEVVEYDHCIGLVEEQREAVQMTADFVVHSVLIPSYSYVAHLADR
jgi:hypothetical protein